MSSTYTNTVSNIGNGMDVNTGKFDVPVTGFYNFEFTATGATEDLDKPVHMWVMVNNAYRFTIYDRSNQTQINIGVSWQFYLHKNDKIWIQFAPADGYINRGIFLYNQAFPAIFKGQLVQENVF